MARYLRAVWILAWATLHTACTGWLSSPQRSGLPDHQVGGYCAAGMPLPQRYEIKALEGVSIGAYPAKDKLNGTILLNLTVSVPSGHRVRLLEREVRFSSPSWPETRRLQVDHIQDHFARRFEPDATLVGLGSDSSIHYSLWYQPVITTLRPQTGLAQVPTFTVAPPAMEIDGMPFQGRPMTFHAYVKAPRFSCGP